MTNPRPTCMTNSWPPPNSLPPTEFIFAALAPVTEYEFDASLHGASSGKVQLCLDQLVPAASAACPAAVSSDRGAVEYVEVEPWPLHGGVMEKGEMKKMHDEFAKEMEEKEKMHDEFEKEQEEKGKMHDEFEEDACSDISEGSVVLFQGVCCRVIRKNPDTVSGGWQTWRACATGGSNSARMEFGFASWRKGVGCSGWVLCHTVWKVLGPLHASWENGVRAEPGKGATTSFRFPENGPARLVGLLTAGSASKFVTDVTPTVRLCCRSWGRGQGRWSGSGWVVVMEEWAQG